MRAVLVDWMIDISVKFNLNTTTLYMAVDVLDRFIEKSQIKRDEFQLIGVTALLISCKIEEIYPPLLKDFVYICDYAYSKE